MKQVEQVSARTVLQPGQAWHLCVAPGTRVVAVRGAVMVHGTMRWLAGQAVRPRTALQEGEAYTAQDAGWIIITSSQQAELYCIRDNSKPEPFLTQLRNLLAASLPRIAFNARRNGKI
jgi:hypothetical protein